MDKKDPISRREARLEKKRRRYAKIIERETPEERRARLDKVNERRKKREANETEVQRKIRLQKQSLCMSIKRATETKEKRDRRLKSVRENTSEKRANETEEKRARRLQLEREYNSKRYLNETAEQREFRLAMKAFYEKERRSQELFNQREDYLQPNEISEVQKEVDFEHFKEQMLEFAFYCEMCNNTCYKNQVENYEVSAYLQSILPDELKSKSILSLCHTCKKYLTDFKTTEELESHNQNEVVENSNCESAVLKNTEGGEDNAAETAVLKESEGENESAVDQGQEENVAKSAKEVDVTESTVLEKSDCEDIILEPAVELSTEDPEEQNDDSFFPFNNLSVEINEVESGANNDNETKEKEIVPAGPETFSDHATIVEDSARLNDVYNSADSTVLESNESSHDGLSYEPEVKLESFDPEENTETSLEDFIYSNSSMNYEEESNSAAEEIGDEIRRYTLSRFPKIFRNVEFSEYDTLQVFYQLLYQRSAWDTQEILKQRILDFSGFTFDNDSEDYFNRDMMLKTLPNDVLVRVAQILSLDQQVQKLYIGGDKARADLITAIMEFLRNMKHMSKQQQQRKPKQTAEVKFSPAATDSKAPVNLIKRCGCRNRCLSKTTKIQRRALLEYLEELSKKKLFESYLLNFIEIKRNKCVNETKQKIRECAYHYKVKLGHREFSVCKGGFTVYHGLTTRGLLMFQNKLKTGIDLPTKMEMSEFPNFFLPETPRKVSPRKSPSKAVPGIYGYNSEEIYPQLDDGTPKPRNSPRKSYDETANSLDGFSSEETYGQSNDGPTKLKSSPRRSNSKRSLVPKRKAWEKEDMINALNGVKFQNIGVGSSSRINNVPRSTLKRYISELGDTPIEEFVTMKMYNMRPVVQRRELTNNEVYNSSENPAEESFETSNEDIKNSEEESNAEGKSGKKQLKEFPLVVTALKNASKELLIDVHFLLFLDGAEEEDLKENILEFSGFTFDTDSEEFDERNEFLQRMSFKIVGDVARCFSLEILGKKEDTIKNILSFLEHPQESYLKAECNMTVSLSDVELDDIEGFSDSDESITCEVVEKKVECIDLISSGEDSDDEKSGKTKSPKKISTPAPTSIIRVPSSHPVTPNVPSTNGQQSLLASSSNNQGTGQRRLRDFETICKIVNTHPHEYLIDIFDLLYLRKHEPATLRKDILDFSGFTFERGSSDYIKRKQLLDRMLYNSVRRIYNTLIHNTTEVKVFSKPTMITEIFQFLFKLPDHDTSVRPAQTVKPGTKTSVVSGTKTAVGTVPAPGSPIGNTTGKLSDLKRVFQRVACFPCEYLTDVHKLLFMTDCDPKVIRQNIFAFKGFKFGPESHDFQQRKMYLEYLTFHSLRKISSVLTTRSVDLRNSTKHELATHLTQVLAEYCNTYTDTEIPEVQINKPTTLSTAVTSSSENTEVEKIVVTPTLDPSLANPYNEPPATTVKPAKPKEAPKTQLPTSLAISIVDARSISSPAVTTTSDSSKRKRKSQTTSKVVVEKKSQSETNQFSDINLPEVEKYRQMYGSNINIYNSNLPTITGITTINASGISQTFPMTQPISLPIVQVQPSQVIGVPILNSVPAKPTEVIVPEECITNEEQPSKKQKTSGSSEKTSSGKSLSPEDSNTFHNKIRDAISEEEEDCDKPLSSLIGHPIDSVLKKNIIDLVEQTNLQDITINGVIQKIFAMYPKFDLSYRKEFVKSTVRSLLYKLGEQGDSNSSTERKTNSPDCSVTTTDIQDNNLDVSSETSMECS